MGYEVSFGETASRLQLVRGHVQGSRVALRYLLLHPDLVPLLA